MVISSIDEYLNNNLDNVLDSGFLPELEDQEFKSGKVRDSFIDEQGQRLMICTDRISAFDYILKQQIPLKGQILTQMTLGWVEELNLDYPLINSPDPNTLVVENADVIPIEFIFRRHMTGSLWKSYQTGHREFNGQTLPNDLKEGDQLPELLFTPTTKAETGHDLPITSEQILEQGILTQDELGHIVDECTKVFMAGEQGAKKAGYLLVDTKFELGKKKDGAITFLDEILTPDSSRFWKETDYQKFLQKLIEKIPDASKEYVRRYLKENGFDGSDGQVMPNLTPEVITNTSLIYYTLHNAFFGESKPLELSNVPVEQRLIANLRAANYATGMFVAIVLGSPKAEGDMEVAKKMQGVFQEYSVPSRVRIGSAHKTPTHVERDIVIPYNKAIGSLAIAVVAGGSNGLGGGVGGCSVHPTYNVPPFKDGVDYLTNIHSSLQMPSNVTTVTGLKPGNVALEILKVMALNNPILRKRLQNKIYEVQDGIIKADGYKVVK